jgi:hypothetical protein
MSDEPRKRTATEAMRLKPATQPTTATLLADTVDRAERAEARLGAVVALHSPLEVTGDLCGECLLPHPCPTVLAARGDTPAPTPPGEQSQ